jgi:hypothetical protein
MKEGGCSSDYPTLFQSDMIPSEAHQVIEALSSPVDGATASDYVLVVDTLVARAALGFPALRPASPVARALAGFLDRQAHDPADPAALDALAGAGDEAGDALLRVAPGFVAPQLAGALADRLAARRLLPDGVRLPRLLALEDPTRCAALLARLEATPGQHLEWIDSTIEAVLGFVDHGRAPPPELARTWQRVEATQPVDPDQSASWLSARLRLAGRSDPVAALPALADAIEQVGAPDLPLAVDSVLGRAARRDPESAWQFYERIEWHHNRAHALKAICGVVGFDQRAATAWARLADELRRPGDCFDRSPRGYFQAALALLDSAARNLRCDLAVEMIELTGPPPRYVLIATWVGLRLAALRDGTWRPSFWDELATALVRRGPGPASLIPSASLLPPISMATLAAWWKVKTLPLPELPWFGVQGTGLP